MNISAGARRWESLVLKVAGAGLLLATGGIHLDLYLTGYRSIPAIGDLFLLQVSLAFVLGALTLASRSRLVCAAGASFAVSTLGGYLLTRWVGLFGFREVRTLAGTVAGLVEIGAFAALAVLALSPARERPRRGVLSRKQGFASGSRRNALLIGALSVPALAALAVSAAMAGPSGAVAPSALVRLGRVGQVRVLTDASGLTLYWFAPDSPTRSSCTGTCAAYWPPLTGTPTRAPGVNGSLTTIRRPGGARQVTYEGHPLYTYVGDTAPGQANGNDLDLNGGVWHEMNPSG